jgi:ankyrin repeat protein
MKTRTWQMAVIVTFGVVFAVTLVLAIGGIWDTSGDQATKGLARFTGILMLLFLAAGLLVFLLTKAPALRIVAVVLAGAPLLVAFVLMCVTVVAERASDYKETARYVFTNAPGQALGDAIERGDLARIRGLVAQGTDPNVPGRHGETPLWFALRKSRVAPGKLLVELGADPNRGPAGEPTALVKAAGRDAYHLVLQAAFAHGASPDTVSAEGRPLLFEALAFNAKENVGLIVEKGARLDVRDDEKRSALVRAIFLRMWPQARLMVERGVPIADPPGYFNLVNVLSETHPPEEGTPEREEFRGLLKALAARGLNLPERK